MAESFSISVIARIHSDFPEKFGIPRQSGLVQSLESKIIFEPEYRDINAVRGMEEFSHLWLIWQFSEVPENHWSPTVRPPRLGGNERMGVFATRSPFRPNRLGLSCVELDHIEITDEYGPIIYIKGADLMDGTPIFDIKPYVKYSDCKAESSCGFTSRNSNYCLTVVIPEELEQQIPANKRDALRGVLAQDPRPSYQRDCSREYGIRFAGFNLRFVVSENTLTVIKISLDDKQLQSM